MTTRLRGGNKLLRISISALVSKNNMTFSYYEIRDIKKNVSKRVGRSQFYKVNILLFFLTILKDLELYYRFREFQYFYVIFTFEKLNKFIFFIVSKLGSSVGARHVFGHRTIYVLKPKKPLHY